MKISIVMSYYNRKKLLENSLHTIEIQEYPLDQLEIIIVDDASSPEESVVDLIKTFNLPIKLFVLDRTKKTWMNPCIPNNIGFSKATGDVILIQNPECMHQGNILEHVENHIKKGIYLNYSCFSIDKKTTMNIDFTKHMVGPTGEIAHENGTNGWYNHSVYKPTGYHFCSAITREDLYDLGGFDERFANGLAYDDNEFLHRIKLKNMLINYIDCPFVFHQFHEGVADRSFVKEGMAINHKILIEKTMRENIYDVKRYNNYYR